MQILWGNVVQSGEFCVTLNPEDRTFYIKEVRMRFLGNIEAKTDAKGRAFLPAQFRKVLQASGEETLVLRRDIYERCLVLYPESVWNVEMDELRGRLSRWDRQEQMVFRAFVSGVVSLSIDGNGRILIPRPYLQDAGISQGIRFVGMSDTIEIWASEGEKDQPFMSQEEFDKVLEDLMGHQPHPTNDQPSTITSAPSTLNPQPSTHE